MPKYTVEYIQKMIDDNGWAPKPKERVNTETWQRASTTTPSKSKTGEAKASPTGAGQTGSASSSGVKITQNTSTKIPQLEEFSPFPALGHIKGYADVDTMLSDGYKMSKVERDYAKNLTDEYFDELGRKIRNGEYTTAQQIALSSGKDEEYKQCSSRLLIC